jgi:hypothetical protein
MEDGMSTLSDADVARVLRVVAQGLDGQLDCNGLLNAADRLDRTKADDLHNPEHVTPDRIREGWRLLRKGEKREGEVFKGRFWAALDRVWSDTCDLRFVETQTFLVPADPAPTRQEPWSKPEHVPGPVCWIRAAEPGAVGYGSLFVAFDKRGIYTRDNDPEDAFVPWAEIHKYEHSLDRVTWLPCTVALPEPDRAQEDEEAWIRAKTEELRNQSGTTWTESIEDAIRAGLAHARGGKETA